MTTIDLHPEDMLDAARRGTLGAAAAEDLHAHLDRCAACRISLTLPDELPEEQAETFALRVVLDYSLEQVAAATGAPVNTVRSRVRLAREKLKTKIEADPDLWDVLRGEA